MKKTDFLIIGGGPVGIQAARIIRAAKPASSVVVLRPEEFSVIYCAIPYAIEGLVESAAIAKDNKLITETGAQLLRLSAKAINFSSKIVTLGDNSQIQYDKLLIATGAMPFMPNVPGKDLKNIFTVKTATDTETIKQATKSAKKVVVIGAGAIGIEQAQAMHTLGIETHLVDMAPHPLANMIDSEFGEIITQEIISKGINWHASTALEKFIGDEYVSQIQFTGGITLNLEQPNDFVIVSVGVKPEINLFENSDLKFAKDGILVNERMQTNIPDVYAAGDCVQFNSAIDGKPLGGKLATNAVPMAKVAAKNLLGKTAEYQGFVNGAATCVGSLRIGGTGFSENFAKIRGYSTVTGFGETTSRFPIMPGAKKVRVKLVADSKTGLLLGGQVVGPDAVAERIDVLSLALQHKMYIKDLANLSYASQPWQTYYPAGNPIVMAAEDALKKL